MARRFESYGDFLIFLSNRLDDSDILTLREDTKLCDVGIDSLDLIDLFREIDLRKKIIPSFHTLRDLYEKVDSDD